MEKIDTLTMELDALIEKILIHESVEGEDGEQEIEIFYRFIGKID